jgi:hypothetical protein
VITSLDSRGRRPCSIHALPLSPRPHGQDRRIRSDLLRPWTLIASIRLSGPSDVDSSSRGDGKANAVAHQIPIEAYLRVSDWPDAHTQRAVQERFVLKQMRGVALLPVGAWGGRPRGVTGTSLQSARGTSTHRYDSALCSALLVPWLSHHQKTSVQS